MLDVTKVRRALQEGLILIDDHIYDSDILKGSRAWLQEIRDEVEEHVMTHSEDFDNMEELRLMAEIQELDYERVCVAATLNKMIFNGDPNHHNAMMMLSETHRVIGTVTWYDPKMIVYLMPLEQPYDEVTAHS